MSCKRWSLFEPWKKARKTRTLGDKGTCRDSERCVEILYIYKKGVQNKIHVYVVSQMWRWSSEPRNTHVRKWHASLTISLWQLRCVDVRIWIALDFPFPGGGGNHKCVETFAKTDCVPIHHFHSIRSKNWRREGLNRPAELLDHRSTVEHVQDVNKTNN